MPGRVVDELISFAKGRIEGIDEIYVERVVMGLGYTAVKLNTGNVGLCYTFSYELGLGPCEIWRRAGTLAGSRAVELIELAKSWDLSEAVVGVATLNALSWIHLEKGGGYPVKEGNFLEYCRIREGDAVAVVGYMRPIVERLRKMGVELYVFERNPLARGEGALPDTAVEELIPKANVVIITGTALVNGTIDRLLELSKSAREVGVVGPSTPLYPDVFFRRGAKILGGVKVVDSEKTLQIVSEGGGAPSLKSVTKQVVVRSDEGE